MKLTVKIVLVETSHPGNIGATARAMKNMGLNDLVLVKPECFPDEAATARASGAHDILENAKITDNLEDAISDCNLVIAASARSRNINWPTYDPRECVNKIIKESHLGCCAVVFGPEQSGLKNEHIDLCHGLLYVPVNPNFSSLNLSMAVQIFCYELRMALVNSDFKEKSDSVPLASVSEMENFYQHLEKMLIKNDFLDPKKPRFLMRRIRKLFAKAAPDNNEINILRGILTSFEKKDLEKNEKI
ncbi:MAG: RNA methyltransferase [Gammaproteobacteria bacterium]|nr:MAG: RNA methyltransferase [Gammaproteobacteria bacterium]|tara:strand:+ start:7253 stop:7987 length:735 start_codon:yes stop_codon:yes gene_type:complete